MAYVITCGDEGVQINEGTRLAFLGSGFRLEGFEEAVKLLKKTLDEPIRVVSCAENNWTKQQLDLSNWEQVDASAQQHVQAIADKNDLLYAGFIPFADPKALEHDIKGHMVRPHDLHLANKIAITIGGGEQTYNLGHFLMSADWVAEADVKLVRQVLQPQIDFYTKLVKADKLPVVLEEEGPLDDAVKAANKAQLEAAGIL